MHQDRLTSQVRRAAWGCAAVLALSAGAHALLTLSAPAWWSALAAAVNAAAGLMLIAVVPGAAWLPLWRRAGWLGERSSLVYVGLAAALTSVACHAASQKFIVLSGYAADYWPMWGAAAVWSAAGVFASLRSGEPVEVDWPRPAASRCALAVAAAAVAFSVYTSPPRFVDETNYWPDKIYRDFSMLNYGHVDWKSQGVEVAFGPEWIRRGDGVYDLAQPRGSVRIVNKGRVSFPVGLVFVLKNRWGRPLMARFWFDGRPLDEDALKPYERYRRREGRPTDDVIPLWPPFDHLLDPRDRPAHLTFVAPTLDVSPGEHVLRMEFLPDPPGGGEEPRLTLVDMSNLTAKEFYRKLQRHFFIADTGDLYETLDFSRNFRRHWIQHSSSYNSRVFDRGGPTSISDEPPGHHFLCYLALTFIRDSITSISLLFLAELALLAGLVVLMAAWDNDEFRWPYALPILAVALAYTRLCRLGAESNAPDTLFLLVWLCAMWAHLDGRDRWACWLAGAAWLIHIPTPQSVVFLGAASWLVTRDRRGLKFILRAAMVIAFITLLRVLIISMEAGLRGALFSGQARFGGVRRLELLREILFEHHWLRVLDLLHVARDFARLVLVASCAALPVYAASLFARARPLPAGEDKKTSVIFLFGLLYYLAMSLIDTQRAHHVGPIAFPWMIAACRRLCRLESPLVRRVLLAAALLAGAGCVVYLLLAGPDFTATFTRFPIYHLTHPSNRRGYGFSPF